MTLFAQRRAAIDAIATVRAKVIRCGLFGTYLFRPNPLHPDTPETQANWRAEMESILNEMQRAATLLKGHDPQDVFNAEICSWLKRCAASHQKEQRALEDAITMTERLIAATEERGGVLEQLLIDHAIFGRVTLFPAITQLCDGFWADMDGERQMAIGRAHETSAAIEQTLDRLEHIGKHVRLVSLNASVEAARVGTVGKGLGVIAQEFKTLAEEIQHLTHSARDSIALLADTPDPER